MSVLILEGISLFSLLSLPPSSTFQQLFISGSKITLVAQKGGWSSDQAHSRLNSESGPAATDKALVSSNTNGSLKTFSSKKLHPNLLLALVSRPLNLSMLVPIMPKDLFHFPLVSHPKCKDRKRLWVSGLEEAGGIRLSVCLLGGAPEELRFNFAAIIPFYGSFHSRGEKNKLRRLKRSHSCRCCQEIDSLHYC